MQSEIFFFYSFHFVLFHEQNKIESVFLSCGASARLQHNDNRCCLPILLPLSLSFSHMPNLTHRKYRVKSNWNATNFANEHAADDRKCEKYANDLSSDGIQSIIAAVAVTIGTNNNSSISSSKRHEKLLMFIRVLVAFVTLGRIWLLQISRLVCVRL